MIIGEVTGPLNFKNFNLFSFRHPQGTLKKLSLFLLLSDNPAFGEIGVWAHNRRNVSMGLHGPR